MRLEDGGMQVCGRSPARRDHDRRGIRLDRRSQREKCGAPLVEAHSKLDSVRSRQFGGDQCERL